MERQAPRQLLYENQLPLAIESKSQRRLFFPEGGSVYGPSGGTNPNIIRIPINADSLLDVQHSYLSFNLKATSGDAANLSPDIGVPFIRRLRIESAGTTLEDIDAYGKLYGGVLFPSQGSAGAISDATLTTHGIGEIAGALSNITNTASVFTATNAQATAQLAAGGSTFGDALKGDLNTLTNAIAVKLNARTITGTSGLNKVIHNVAPSTKFVGNGNTTRRYNVPLVSGLLNMEKYLPLVMMNAGITLELELDVAASVGLGRNAAANAFEVPSWEINDVRYVAHLIDLQRDFYDKMRMVMEGSGGVLQLAGSTFRHYSGATNGADTDSTINLPARVKSIQSVFFTQTPAADLASGERYGVSNSLPNGIDSYQFRIGAVVYPPTPVQLARNGNVYINKGEAYQELRKAFGTLGDYLHGGVMVSEGDGPATGFLCEANTGACSSTAAMPAQSPLGLDFQSFPKTALESGINTADRSLNMSLEIKRSGGVAGAVVVDAWIMADAIFYINLDGSVSVSV